MIATKYNKRYYFIMALFILIWVSVLYTAPCLAEPEALKETSVPLNTPEEDTNATSLLNEDKLMIEDDYHYNPIGKRDPFYSKILEEEVDESRPKTLIGLQRYELSELNLVGIVSDASGKKALMESSEGKSYIIKKGTPIGKKDGIVVDITENEVIIQEYITDYLGNRIEKTTEIKLSKKDKEEEQDY